MKFNDMAKTQELAIPETCADVYRTDPLGVYKHRQDLPITSDSQLARLPKECETEGEWLSRLRMITG